MHHLKEQFQSYFKPKKVTSIEYLGKGFWGEAYAINLTHNGKEEKIVIKTLLTEGNNYPLPIDQWYNYASSYHASNNIQFNARVTDVIGLDKEGFHSVIPKEKYFQVLEYKKGKPYFDDVQRIISERQYNDDDVKKVKIIAQEIAKLHQKPIHIPEEAKKAVYYRVTREIITNSELMFPLFDNNYGKEKHWFEKEFENVFVELFRAREKIKPHWKRLAYVHGDFWRGNMFFDGDKFFTLDASRFPSGLGEPGVDVFSGGYSNYFMNALIQEGDYSGPLNELGTIFMKEYIKHTKDEDIGKFMPFLFGSLLPILMRPGIIGGSEENTRKVYQTCLDALRKGELKWKNLNKHLE